MVVLDNTNNHPRAKHVDDYYCSGSDSSVIPGSNTTNPNQNEKKTKGSDSSVMVEINGFCRYPEGAPRQGVGLCPRTNDTRYIFPTLSRFSARVVLARSATQKAPILGAFCVVDRNHTNPNPLFRFSEKCFRAVVELSEKL